MLYSESTACCVTICSGIGNPLTEYALLWFAVGLCLCFELLVWCKVSDCSFYATEHMGYYGNTDRNMDYNYSTGRGLITRLSLYSKSCFL